MVQKTFGIYGDELKGNKIFIETGTEYIACWLMNDFTVTGFEFFATEKFKSFSDKFYNAKLFSRILGMEQVKKHFIFSAETCFISNINFIATDQIFNYYYPSIEDYQVNQFKVKDYYISYNFPKAAKDMSSNAGISHKFQHFINKEESRQSLYLAFYPGYFSLCLQKSDDAFFINNYYFKKPDDVLYFVLLALQNFQLNPSVTPIEIGGMIDADSHVYKELFAFFPQLTLAGVTAGIRLDVTFKDYPVHYFAPFLNFIE